MFNFIFSFKIINNIPGPGPFYIPTTSGFLSSCVKVLHPLEWYLETKYYPLLVIAGGVGYDLFFFFLILI
jgi:hypothetical protein